MSADHKYNISNIAEMLGFGRDTVRKRIKAAELPKAGREGNADLYYLKDAAVALFGNTGSTGSAVDPNKMKPGDRRAWYQSENERLKFELEISVLCQAEKVRTEFSNLAKPMLAELEVLPDILERDCGLPPDAVQMVQSKIDDLRNNIAQAVENS